MEIVCDESGYEGEKLIGTTTDVFAHTSMRLNAEAAAECIRELRMRIRSPATEYKANHILREKHRHVLLWFLGPSGPLRGNAHVFLIDKAYFVLSKVTGLLLGDDTAARTLYRQGLPDAFLVAANNLMRVKDRLDQTASVDAFFDALEELPKTDQILEQLRQSRPRAEAFRAELFHNVGMLPPMDPLFPAIIRAVTHWGADGTPISITHHRQNTLPHERIAQLQEVSQLAGLTFLDWWDLRVQVADVIAGAVRKIASDELNGRGDPQLTELLPSFVDPASIWGDERSWARLRP